MVHQRSHPVVSILALVLIGSLVPTTGRPCTTFVLQGDHQLYFGRNLDWDWEDGLVIINPRGIRKTAWVAPGHEPARWSSKYSSVTFNQFGQESPFGGMNETGLVVEQMMLMETEYPTADPRPEIGMLQWIQYQLDTCRTTAEVIATDKLLRLEQPTHPARIHYLVCDAAGDSATIEFLGGRMVCHRANDLPFRALANSTYTESVEFTRAQGIPKATDPAPTNRSSLARFRCAAGRAAGFKAETPERNLDYAFDTLSQVAQGEATVWSIVYDPVNLAIHYRTRSQPQRRTLDFRTLKLADRRSAQFAGIQTRVASSSRPDWQELTEARHRAYLEAFLGQESVRRGFADLTQSIEPMLQVLRGYTPESP